MELACRTACTKPQFDHISELENPSDQFKQAFLDNRYLVGPPWQYGLLIQLISQGQIPMSSEKFLDLCEKEQNHYQGFAEAYFEQRKKLASNPESWAQFMGPYNASEGVFRKLFSQKQLRILSTRDGISIKRIIKLFWDIDLESNTLLERGTSNRSKAQILQDFAASQNVSTEQVFFIDDYLHHLLPAKELGFDVHLASWGYLGPNDKESALKLGLSCVDLEDLEAIVAKENNHDSRSDHRT